MPCEGMPFILVIGAHTQCEFLMDEKAPLLHLPWQHDKKLTFSYLIVMPQQKIIINHVTKNQILPD